MTASPPRRPWHQGRALRVCAWFLLTAAVEVFLYASYRGHDARFHWFTHFFVGASAALLLMGATAAVIRRPVPLPLVWPVVGHLVAMFPDFLFSAGMAHHRWMDVFLGHISTHFVPGRNFTWYLVFLAALGLYLVVLDRLRCQPSAASTPLSVRVAGARPRGGGSGRLIVGLLGANRRRLVAGSGWCARAGRGAARRALP